MAKKNGTSTRELPELSIAIRTAHGRGVPLVAVATVDPAKTIYELRQGINGRSEVQIAWDIVRGMVPLTDDAKTVIAGLKTKSDYQDANGNPLPPQDPTIGDPLALLTTINSSKVPAASVIYMHMAGRFCDKEYGVGAISVIQAVENLRDEFKRDNRMLVMLGPSTSLPIELQSDVMTFDEPLPDGNQLAEIVRACHTSAKVADPTDEQVAKSVEAVQGLSAFAAEQALAVSIRSDGVDIDRLWERKRKAIEATQGLKVYSGKESFGDIGGVRVIKSYIDRIMKGRDRPNAVIWLDEVEKQLAGTGDSSGVSQDQLGCLLGYMQDNSCDGMIFVGPAGSGKSMVAKAAGNMGGVPTIQMDLGGTKSKYVGDSEAQLRQALKVITSVSNGRSLWIATANNINVIPPELIRRFSLGTFFYDLPTVEERAVIWNLYRKKYEIDPADKTPLDEGWTGAEVQRCTMIAWKLNSTLKDASQFIVPISQSASEQISRLRTMATDKFLSASYEGRYNPEHREPTTGGRKINIDE